MLEPDSVDFFLDAAAPISPQIYRHLRERIIRNELKPGNRISEAEVAREFGVSRQPIREAFIKLSEQGLLAIRPQRGTIVRKIAYTAVLDARFMREAVEASILAILAEDPGPELIRDLRVQIACQRRLDGSDPDAFIQADEHFHRSLAEGAGKAGVWTLLEGLKSQMDRVRYLALGRFPVAKLIDQHERIVDSIESGRRENTDAAIRAHLREVLHDLPMILDAHPEFFELPGGYSPDLAESAVNSGGRG